MSGPRIVVALGGVSPPLEAAVQLAARLEAELVGLFVEDENWRRLAALPFARLAGHGPLSQAIDPEVLERALRRGAAEARTALARAASPRLRWTLRVVRGHVVAEAVGAAAAGDLVVVPADALATGGFEAAARGRVDVLGLRAGAQARRVLVAPGAGAAVARAAERVARLCGWRPETGGAAALAPGGHPPDVVIAVSAVDVPPALRRAPCSLLVVHVPAPGDPGAGS